MDTQKVSKHTFRAYKELYYKCETYGVGVMVHPFMITNEESVIDNVSKVWILEYLIKHKLVTTVENYVIRSLQDNKLRLYNFSDATLGVYTFEEPNFRDNHKRTLRIKLDKDLNMLMTDALSNFKVIIDYHDKNK